MHGELAARHPALTTFLRERIDGGVAEKEALRVGLSGGTDSSDGPRWPGADGLRPPGGDSPGLGMSHGPASSMCRGADRRPGGDVRTAASPTARGGRGTPGRWRWAAAAACEFRAST